MKILALIYLILNARHLKPTEVSLNLTLTGSTIWGKFDVRDLQPRDTALGDDTEHLHAQRCGRLGG
jgi:hypothetical protein